MAMLNNQKVNHVKSPFFQVIPCHPNGILRDALQVARPPSPRAIPAPSPWREPQRSTSGCTEKSTTMRRGRGSPGGCDNGISPTRPGCGSGISHTWLGDGVGKQNLLRNYLYGLGLMKEKTEIMNDLFNEWIKCRVLYWWRLIGDGGMGWKKMISRGWYRLYGWLWISLVIKSNMSWLFSRWLLVFFLGRSYA